MELPKKDERACSSFLCQLSSFFLLYSHLHNKLPAICAETAIMKLIKSCMDSPPSMLMEVMITFILYYIYIQISKIIYCRFLVEHFGFSVDSSFRVQLRFTFFNRTIFIVLLSFVLLNKGYYTILPCKTVAHDEGFLD